MKISKLFLLASLVLLCTSCRSYSIVFRNVSDKRIIGFFYKSSTLDWGSSYSVLKESTSTTYMDPPQKVPKTITIIWNFVDGTRHEKTIEVKKLFPRNFRGDVVYEISDDDIKVVFEKD